MHSSSSLFSCVLVEREAMVLDFRVPATDLPNVSAFFGHAAQRIRECNRCGLLFAAGKRTDWRCKACGTLRADGLRRSFRDDWRRLQTRLAQHVRGKHLAPMERDALLAEALQDARALPLREWREMWDRRTKRRPGRPANEWGRGRIGDTGTIPAD